jgi:phosphomethylpyrimidine synthase
MKITQDVRDYAASLGDNEKAALGLSAKRHPEKASVSPPPDGDATSETARAAGSGVGALSQDDAERGMKEMSQKFKEMGGNVYLDAEKVKESNKALQ